MPLPASFFADEAELGKKDDDRKPPARRITPLPSISPRWRSAIPRLRKRRFIAFVLALLVLYHFFKNIPTGLTPVSQRVDTRVPWRTVNGMPLRDHNFPSFSTPSVFSSSNSKSGKPPKPKPDDDNEEETVDHNYNGEFALTSLSDSLQSLARTIRFNSNKNVLFSAANLQSASRLIPLACDMARWNRNVVHFAYMGRDNVPLDVIQELNGADIGCEVYWHDARPDYSMYSTDERMRKATVAALDSIGIFMRPQVYFCDGTAGEEAVFLQEYKAKAGKEARPLVELPKDAAQRMMWITRLDTGSLIAWHRAYIDILIQAPSNDVGSLVRLLKSLETADYFGVRHPHLTIEIPPDMDAPSRRVLDSFVWPPLEKNKEPHTSQLTLRKKISFSSSTPLEASIRTVESFYPARPLDSHLLLLSPHVELSPMFYHYLYYHLLEYHYSTYNGGTLESENLMGISLATPTFQIDQKTPFIPPAPRPHPTLLASVTKNPTEAIEWTDSPDATPFMWQMPDTSATLYFGHRWQELHSFLSLRISQTSWPTARELSPILPAFAEPMFELMRLRGYTILYPNLPAHSIAIDHPPTAIHEEFLPPPSFDPASDQNQGGMTDPYEAPTVPNTQDGSLLRSTLPQIKPLATTPLANILPSQADLPELPNLPLLNPLCEPAFGIDLHQAGRALAADFRYMTGGCSESVSPLLHPGSADDLFCDADGEPMGGSIITPSEAAEKGVFPLDRESLRQARERGRELAKERAGTTPKNIGEVGGSTGKSVMDPSFGTPMGGIAPGTGGAGQNPPVNGPAFWDVERGLENVDDDQSAALQEVFQEHLRRQGAGSAAASPTGAQKYGSGSGAKEATIEKVDEMVQDEPDEDKGEKIKESEKEEIDEKQEKPAGW